MFDNKENKVMELKNRLDLLSQAAEMAQKNGVFSLDDAVVVKKAVDSAKNNENLKEATNVLVKIAQVAQKKGVFTLKDAFYLYMAIDGIDKELEKEELEKEDTNQQENKQEDTKKGEE